MQKSGIIVTTDTCCPTGSGCKTRQIGLLRAGTHSVSVSCCPIEIGEFNDSETIPNNPANQCKQSGETLRLLALESDKSQEHIKQQSRPDLPLNGILGVTQEVAYFEGLLDLLKECFGAPPATIQVTDTGKCPFNFVGQKDHNDPFIVTSTQASMRRRRCGYSGLDFGVIRVTSSSQMIFPSGFLNFMRRSELLKMIKDLPEKCLNHIAVGALIGIRKVVATGKNHSTNHGQFCRVMAQGVANIIEADGMGKLIEKQTHHVTPQGENSGFFIGSIIARKFLRQMRRDQFTKLMQCVGVILGWCWFLHSSGSFGRFRAKRQSTSGHQPPFSF